MIAIVPIGATALGITLKQRLTSKLTRWDAAIPLVLMNPLQVETVEIVPNLSHSALPLFLLLAFANCWISKATVWRFIAAPFIAGVALFTGFGIFVFAGALLVFCLEWIDTLRRRKPSTNNWRLVGLALLLATPVLFGIGYRWNPANPDLQFPHEPLYDYLVFVDHLFGRLFYLPKGLRPYAGFVVLMAVTATAGFALIRRWRVQDATATVSELFTITTLSFAIATAVGRVSFGSSGGGSSRYLTLALLAIFALHLLVATSKQTKAATMIHAILLALIATSYASSSVCAADSALTKQVDKQRGLDAYQQSNDAVQATEVSGFQIYPNPEAIDESLDRHISLSR